MRWDILAREMHPINANDAWWAGWEACVNGETENPYPISGPNGESVPAYWFWDAGWWYRCLEY